MARTTLVILLDAFRGGPNGYLDPIDTPFLWYMMKHGLCVTNMYNTGGFCERSVFMTGAKPETTGNYFALSYMPAGYKRPDYEPKFNVPRIIRDRLCMTEDLYPDINEGSFYNPDTKETIESFWDILRKTGKGFAVEACLALGIQSYQGVTTHGTRAIQLVDKIRHKCDLYYIQFSETDQLIHYTGTKRSKRKSVLRFIDGQVEWLVRKFKKGFKELDILVFGDHGMADIEKRVDFALEYPPYNFGYDYLYLKSSTAIQFWIFNSEVVPYIVEDPKLFQYGSFIDSPSVRQGELIWRANKGVLVSPCHFHKKDDPVLAMHGWNPTAPEMQGMAVIYPRKQAVINKALLNDICPTICNLVGIRYPKQNIGRSLV
jgi:hypothetical protein